MSISTESVENK